MLKTSKMHLPIIFKNEEFIVINKPHGLLVHKTNLAKYELENAQEILTQQIESQVFVTHRLDRKTFGLLIFALTKDAQKAINKLFRAKEITKKYTALVRGFTEEKGTINYALKNDDCKVQDAVTHYQTLKHIEIALPFGKHKTSRYSIVEVEPETGRFHQIRKHFAHIYHPIIGDRPHGCNKQNKLFKEKFAMTKMLLCATNLKFSLNENDYEFKIGVSNTFDEVLTAFNQTS